jgi:energy-converting hydrogenase Eha subunit F
MGELIGVAFIVLSVVILFAMGMRLPNRPSPLHVKPPPIPQPEMPLADVLQDFERQSKEQG